MMRILFQLIGSDLGGGQRVAADIATALRRRGHAIGLLVPDQGPALAAFEPADARAHIARLGSLRRPWDVLDAAFILHGYDLLYSHTSLPGEILGSWAARLARRPQLVHRHSYLDVSPRPFVGPAQRVLYRRAVGKRSVIAVADHVKQELVQLGVDDDAVVVIPNGTTIIEEAEAARTNGPFRIGMLGRLDVQKGADVFIDAAARARLAHPATWTIAGPPGPDAMYEAKLRTSAAAAGVTVEGRVDPGSAFLRGLDVVVVPSRYEAHPLVVLEALALGRPVVAADIPGMRAVLGDGAGLLVQPEDGAALAAAIERLTADDELRVKLSARGRALVQARYDVRETVARAVEVVERAGVSRAHAGRRA